MKNMYQVTKKYLVFFPIFALFIGFSLITFSLIYKLTLSNKVLVSPLATGGQKLLVVASNEAQAQERIEGTVVAADGRLELIKRYLTRYRSPLLPYAELILNLSETYGFDYRFILAIGQQESNLCKKIIKDSHNCWGYGIHSKGTLTFASYELALKSYAAYLKRAYFDLGLDTPELIERKYNPVSNGSWAYGVSFFMDQIESGNF